eukprot:SAG31_NODE_942_length_10853_cov_24.620420_3_plen_68_part_00
MVLAFGALSLSLSLVLVSIDRRAAMNLLRVSDTEVVGTALSILNYTYSSLELGGGSTVLSKYLIVKN